MNAEQNSQGVSPVNPEGVGPRHIRDEPAPDVASRGASTDDWIYRSSEQTKYPVSLSSILWPGEGSNPNLPPINWNDSSRPALTDPQFDERNEFSTAGESPIGSSFYVIDQQLPLSTSEILIFRNYVDTVSRWVNSTAFPSVLCNKASLLIMPRFRSTLSLGTSPSIRSCLCWRSDVWFS